jgi:polysaccharide chain length determinant protein (PEP-CTERM system associated)
VANSPVHTLVHDILDQLSGAWRYRWVALWVAWGTAFVLWAVVFLVPNTYEASARVFVDTRTTLSQATEGIGLGEDIDSQIERVRQALAGLPQLQRVAAQTGLLAGAVTPPAKQRVLEKLRDDLDINEDARDGAAVFTITYRNASRDESLKVVDRLLNTFVEGTLGGKRLGSEEAQQFLMSQIADYAQRLGTAEQRLADFKRQHVGLMPGDQGDYFTRLQNESEALANARDKLAVALRQRDELLQELQNGQPYSQGSPGGGMPESAMTASASDTEMRIQRTRQRLDDLLLRFTPKYPDVVTLRETLRELEARKQAEMAAAQHGDSGAAAQLGLSANPVYQKIQEQFNREQVTVASMRQEVSERKARVESLQAKVNLAPEVEAQLTKLTRDYDVTRAQYNALLVRLDQARLGQQAMATGIVKFQIISPPSASYEPVAPQRGRLIIASLVAALAAGLGAAYALYLLRPVFVSTRQLGAVTGLQVLGAVGMAWVDRFRAQRRLSNLLFIASTGALFFLGCAMLYLHGHISEAVRELLA